MGTCQSHLVGYLPVACPRTATTVRTKIGMRREEHAARSLFSRRASSSSERTRDTERENERDAPRRRTREIPRGERAKDLFVHRWCHISCRSPHLRLCSAFDARCGQIIPVVSVSYRADESLADDTTAHRARSLLSPRMATLLDGSARQRYHRRLSSAGFIHRRPSVRATTGDNVTSRASPSSVDTTIIERRRNEHTNTRTHEHTRHTKSSPGPSGSRSATMVNALTNSVTNSTCRG
jgi:hypothetical protein